jgi:hypothetical protein
MCACLVKTNRHGATRLAVLRFEARRFEARRFEARRFDMAHKFWFAVDNVRDQTSDG